MMRNTKTSISRFRLYHAGRMLCLCLCLLAMAGCEYSDWPIVTHGEGYGGIAVSLQGSQTRSTTTVITKEEADLFLVTLYKGEDLVSQQILLGRLASLTFPAGYGYKVFVENITIQDSETMNDGWGAKRYAGTSRSFGIQAGQTTKVSVGCSVANAAVSVNIDESASGCVVTISSGDRTLVTTESRTAYFNVTPEAKPDVTVRIEKDGVPVSEKTFEGLEAAQVKDVNIKVSSDGRLGINVTYDDSFETVETEIEIDT